MRRAMAISILCCACGSGGGSASDGGGTPDAEPSAPDAGPGRPDAAPAPTMGTLALHLEADRGGAADDVISLGVPFPPGALVDPAAIVVRDPGGNEVAAHSESIATWPRDGSQRSVLVAFRATLGAGTAETGSIDYGARRTIDAGPLGANPDGPVAATLDPAWYATSRVIGFQVPAAANSAFTGWELEIERYLAEMSPPWESYGLSCGSTSAERTYYDGPHALYQRFIHRGGAQAYRRAREEATWYRANELIWFDGGTIALYACSGTWDPDSPLAWGDLRRMLGQGMLDDWLLSGDPDARAAVLGLGEALRQNTPALTGGGEITVLVTERNMAWPMMGLASAYAADHRADTLAALSLLVDLTLDWQAQGTSGAFEHDIVRPDPSECGDGPRGASPFMTSLLVDGLMEAYVLTGDDRIPASIVAVSRWYRDDAITSDGVAFQYLWGCNDVDYDDSSTADLNLLISHVFGAAFYVSDDQAWLDFGDTMANHGIDNMYAGAPKQWNQSTRSFLKYMGYRALARTP